MRIEGAAGLLASDTKLNFFFNSFILTSQIFVLDNTHRTYAVNEKSIDLTLTIQNVNLNYSVYSA
jgi:hypothetical protein